MNERFADWYRLADPDPRSETLSNRWSVIDSQARAADAAIAIDLIRLFTGMRQSDVGSAPAFVGAFKEADPALPMRDNDLLVQILAGATLSKALTYKDPVADVTGLALQSIRFAGQGRTGAFADLMGDADAYLEKRAREIRVGEQSAKTLQSSVGTKIKNVEFPDMPKLTRPDAYQSNTGINQALKQIETHAGEVRAGFEALHGVMVQLSKDVSRISNEVAQRATDRLSGAQEELDILWWLFGESSRDLGISAEAVGVSAFSVIAGKELADLTTRIPGVLAAKAMLHRALRATGSVPSAPLSFKETIEATSEDWRRAFVASPDAPPDHLRDIAPVHLAVRNSLEHGNAWATTFRKAMGLKRDPKLAAVELAGQVYIERLLARAIRAAKP